LRKAFMRGFMRLTVTIAALLVLGFVASSVADTPQRSVLDGVFTAEQSTHGKAQYAARCALCHGATLSGTDSVPPLTGSLFLANWSGLSAGDLFQRIRTTMPANDPGSLDDATVIDLIAFVLSMNQFPAGSAKLPRDLRLLQQIGIITPAH
jgi:S-disulfanyl-L-cysteine oxidoreductase SoxD